MTRPQISKYRRPFASSAHMQLADKHTGLAKALLVPAQTIRGISTLFALLSPPMITESTQISFFGFELFFVDFTARIALAQNFQR